MEKASQQNKSRLELRNSVNNFFHQPILLKEVEELLNIKRGEWYLDATVGGGGHAKTIIAKGGRVLGLDWDQDAIEFASKALAFLSPNGEVCPTPPFPETFSRNGGAKSQNKPNKDWLLIRENFSKIRQVAAYFNLEGEFAGVLFDLGTSFYQLTTPERGFSFKSQALDMRMSQEEKVNAADLLKVLSEKELAQIFEKFSQEKMARPLAKAIVQARQKKPLESGEELAALIENVYRQKGEKRGKIHPATKVFQALRIAVNDEINNLKRALPQALGVLKRGGRLLVISFHEGEDREVKNFFRNWEKEGKAKILTPKPVSPKEEEKRLNQASRSAKLRAILKV
ncbi:16S rRNA (cytosine(1402)-N(4))-methyltransferase RsmH [Candidatus Shapirobacteria bacterium]|nr:16S rRNA (cytosine(1402)-N(4))-methyltransferase RsmH [Candidatus Shapirobacteria bacterium]